MLAGKPAQAMEQPVRKHIICIHVERFMQMHKNAKSESGSRGEKTCVLTGQKSCVPFLLRSSWI